MKKTTNFENALIWFGAGVSLAEILTGTYFSSLGFTKGLLAIVIGHIIGCVLLFFAGVIGGIEEKSSMETVKDSFGSKGGLIFAFLNVLQLAGWTAIMIYDGAIASGGIFGRSRVLFCLIIGLLILIWIMIGIRNLQKINVVSVAGLFVLSVLLCYVIFYRGSNLNQVISDELSFGAAVELAAAMPLSWLPLISDYTREARQPVRATLTSTVTYGFVSIWMYVIGMGASIFTGESDIAQIMLKSGLGVSALIIVVLSTVTTTFLDAWSAGISFESITTRFKGNHVAMIVAVIGTLAAIIFPMDDITGFLYLIGSVFAPMIAIQIAEYFVIKRKPSEKEYETKNLIIWLVGFIIYRLIMNVDFILGNTLPDMLITGLICIVFSREKKSVEKNSGEKK